MINIENINLELTTRCNLKCPFCYRAIYKNSGLTYENHDFPKELWPQLGLENIKVVIICGTFGDVIFYPHLLEFLRYAYDVNPEIEITMHTNGSAHETSWWEELATILRNKQHYITFALDGLEDTHGKHRVGSDFNTVIRNLKTVKAGGCKVVWQYIMFKHNEHQISKARRMSKQLKCDDFIIRKSFIYTGSFEKPSFFPDIMDKVEHTRSGVGTVLCRINTHNEIAIMADGNVTPCCRVTPKDYDNLGFKPLNLKDYNLQEIINAGYVQEVVDQIDTKPFCRQCFALSNNSHTIESLLLENIRMKRIKKDLEQKKDQANKR